MQETKETRQIEGLEEQKLGDLQPRAKKKSSSNRVRPSPPKLEKTYFQHSPRTVRTLVSARGLASALVERSACIPKQINTSINNDNAVLSTRSNEYGAESSSPKPQPSISHDPNIELNRKPIPPRTQSPYLQEKEKDIHQAYGKTPIDAEIQALLRNCPDTPTFLYDSDLHRAPSATIHRYSNQVHSDSFSHMRK